MAAVDDGGNFAVTTTAQSLTVALSIAGNKHFNRVSVKLSAGALSTGTCYWGNSDVQSDGTNAHGELEPGRGYDFYSGVGWLVNTDDIYIAGPENAANVLFVNCMA